MSNLKTETGQAEVEEQEQIKPSSSDPSMRLEESSSLADFETLSREYEDLQNKVTCKICLDAKIEVLFLPCRHLVCCAKCASMVRECPFCRKNIEGTVKVFM